VAVATVLLLNLLGVAIGASSIHAFDITSTDHARYGISAGIWAIINLALAMALGGYVAARLSGTHSHLDAELHGMTMWGVALLLGSVLLAYVTGAVGHVVEQGVGAIVSRAVDSAPGMLQPEFNSRAMIGRLEQSLGDGGDPTTMSREQIGAEIASLANRSLSGSVSEADRNRLVALVAAYSGITKEEAARRVNLVENDVKANLARAEESARAAEDEIAHRTALGARALFTALVIGLLTALVGAWIGTRHKRVLHPEHGHDAHAPAYPTHTVGRASLSTYDDTGHLVSQYLRGVSFPVSKQDLLRLARSGNAGASLLHSIENLREGSYTNTNEVLRALGVAH
jgi:hypothetical protein